MIKIYPAKSRYSANHGWLKSNFSFSFAQYYNPSNMNFGPLRVFNDDFVAPLNGFGEHPHRDMEIVSVVLKGQLQHEDNTGNKEILKPGEVQRMSAGTGIVHSEVNPSADEEANFLQLWFLPNKQGLTPTYEQTAYDLNALKNNLLPIVSNRANNEKIAFVNQDLTLYLSELEVNKSISFTQDKDRRIYVFVIEGEVTLNQENKLKKRDAARITDITNLEIATEIGASFMLIDLP
ncbi:MULTISPECIES: pirin family protein [unclassified Paenibacillus]|uniref:pirin family protein n=1 Tax=unclassified Paenibacillus TaxID=185978 RepID=UPI001AEB7A66|nr:MULTISPECIES: pirin family protein [unclassified Paenibacillus]MBP1157063.1 redox-sensitive bicupin YhaK (pirin superfamily) [Paenibacillus sp. PvP091]MBP1172198.1 redox-sensitive bicupin YhaK (pirin superfamily) [Paenibacillus sp. PvR098]MBP2438579.1 redox-sensitive bicupin YhaK (pirin superfamily) [Paenibacillus sp. PvP052]